MNEQSLINLILENKFEIFTKTHLKTKSKLCKHSSKHKRLLCLQKPNIFIHHLDSNPIKIMTSKFLEFFDEFQIVLITITCKILEKLFYFLNKTTKIMINCNNCNKVVTTLLQVIM